MSSGGGIKGFFQDIITRDRNAKLRARLIREGKINPTDDDRKRGLAPPARVPAENRGRGRRGRVRGGGILQAR